MRFPSLPLLTRSAADAAFRFPAAFAAAALAVGAIMWLIEDGGDPALRVFLTGLLGLPLLISLSVFAETRAWTGPSKWVVLGAGAAVLVVFYLLVDPSAEGFEYRELKAFLGFWAVAHLLVAIAPYALRQSPEDFWEYNKQLFAQFVVGAAYTMILYAGLAAAIFAVNALFDLHINGKVYAHLLALLAGIFNAFFFLANFPKTFHFDHGANAFNEVFVNLCKYILIPIVGLYFLILYAYSARILVMWELPRGWVSSLVIGFSVAGIFTYLLNYRLPAFDDSASVRLFHRWFWVALLPMTLLLFVAIGRRIADYGITEERYYVAHTGLWLFCTCLYFLVSSRDNIRYIPLSLIFFISVAVTGPWSAYQLSVGNQMARFKAIAAKTGRLENGWLKPGASELTGPDAELISGEVYYLTQRGQTDKLKALLPIPPNKLPGGPWEGIKFAPALLDWLLVRTGETSRFSSNVFVSPVQENANQEKDVQGFPYFYTLRFQRDQHVEQESGRYMRLAPNGRAIEWWEWKKGKKVLLETFDLSPLLAKWSSGQEYGSYQMHEEEMPFSVRQLSGVELRLFVSEASLETAKTEASLNYLHGTAFVRTR